MIRDKSKVIVVEYPDGSIKVSQVIAESLIAQLQNQGCKVTVTKVDNSLGRNHS